MKVTRETPDQMILSHTPWLTGIFLVIVVIPFIAIAIFRLTSGENSFFDSLSSLLIPIGVFSLLFYSLVQRVQILLDRPSDSLTIRRRTLLGYSAKTFKLSDFRIAEMQVNNAHGSERLYRPVLHFVHADGISSVPIFRGYSNWSGRAHKVIEALNAWNDAIAVDSGS